jgi:peptide-methionine (S)-S-oxide reductase
VRILLPLVAAAVVAACASPSAPAPATAALPAGTDTASVDTLVLAGGCFWCMEKPFEQIDGVLAAVSGFAGGHVPNPTYDQVSTKTTGHIEVVQILYDASRVTPETLLRAYWHNVDPLDGGGQFCDRGEPYRPAIFAPTPAVRALAETQRDALAARFGREIAVEIRGPAPFYPAEAYHQDFYRTNRAHYERYRAGCGRDTRLEALWGEAAGTAGDAL